MCDAFALGSKESGHSYLNEVTVVEGQKLCSAELVWVHAGQSSVGSCPGDGTCLRGLPLLSAGHSRVLGSLSGDGIHLWGLPLVPAGQSRVLGSLPGLTSVFEACPSFLLSHSSQRLCWLKGGIEAPVLFFRSLKQIQRSTIPIYL